MALPGGRTGTVWAAINPDLLLSKLIENIKMMKPFHKLVLDAMDCCSTEVAVAIRYGWIAGLCKLSTSARQTLLKSTWQYKQIPFNSSLFPFRISNSVYFLSFTDLCDVSFFTEA